MVEKKIILLYFFKFYLTSWRGKEYFAKLNQKPGAVAVFLAPWSLSRLGKKIRSQSRLKKNQESEREPLKNYPAPQPWFHSMKINQS